MALSWTSLSFGVPTVGLVALQTDTLLIVKSAGDCTTFEMGSVIFCLERASFGLPFLTRVIEGDTFGTHFTEGAVGFNDLSVLFVQR